MAKAFKFHPIKKWYLKKSMEQKDAAHLIGISPPTLSGIINGNNMPSEGTIIKVHLKTGITGKQLMNWYFDPKRTENKEG